MLFSSKKFFTHQCSAGLNKIPISLNFENKFHFLQAEMSTNNTPARDFIKNFNAEDRKKDNHSISSSSENDDNYPEDDQENLRLNSLDLFQNNHILKLQRLVQKSAKVAKSRGSRFVYPDGGSRAPSFLEQQLLPGIKIADAVPLLESDNSSGAQLTIFYKGFINVYDDVSIDKARAIMLMAGESSKYIAHKVKNVPEPDASKPTKESNPSAVCKLQTNIHIATKRSLRLFFDKRRDRILNKFPYATSMQNKQEDD